MNNNVTEQKTIVITGASSGIGLVIAKDVAIRGDVPILVARSTEKLQKLSEDILETTGIVAPYFTLDVSDSNAVTKTFEQILREHKVDVLINNAGYGVFDALVDARIEDIIGMFQVNVLGLIACTKAVLPSMLDRNKGHIINIASQAGKLATPKSSIYSATKHAVLGMTNSLRMELKGTNIHVSAVNPGPIKTAFFDRADQTGSYKKNVEKYMLDASYVSKKVIDLVDHPKREINLPYWMGIGTKFYQIFPKTFEKLAGKMLNQK